MSRNQSMNNTDILSSYLIANEENNNHYAEKLMSFQNSDGDLF